MSPSIPTALPVIAEAASEKDGRQTPQRPGRSINHDHVMVVTFPFAKGSPPVRLARGGLPLARFPSGGSVSTVGLSRDIRIIDKIDKHFPSLGALRVSACWETTSSGVC